MSEKELFLLNYNASVFWFNRYMNSKDVWNRKMNFNLMREMELRCEACMFSIANGL